jgi:hypothetical protein
VVIFIDWPSSVCCWGALRESWPLDQSPWLAPSITMMDSTWAVCSGASSHTCPGRCTRKRHLCTSCPTRKHCRTSHNCHCQSKSGDRRHPNNALVHPHNRSHKHHHCTPALAHRRCRKCRCLPRCSLWKCHKRLGWSWDRCIFQNRSQGGRRSLRRTFRAYTPDCFRKRMIRHRRRSSHRSDGGRIENRRSPHHTRSFP